MSCTGEQAPAACLSHAKSGCAPALTCRCHTNVSAAAWPRSSPCSRVFMTSSGCSASTGARPAAQPATAARLQLDKSFTQATCSVRNVTLCFTVAASSTGARPAAQPATAACLREIIVCFLPARWCENLMDCIPERDLYPAESVAGAVCMLPHAERASSMLSVFGMVFMLPRFHLHAGCNCSTESRARTVDERERRRCSLCTAATQIAAPNSGAMRTISGQGWCPSPWGDDASIYSCTPASVPTFAGSLC